MDQHFKLRDRQCDLATSMPLREEGSLPALQIADDDF